MTTASDRKGETIGNVVGLKPLTGELVWEYSNWNCHIPVPSAVDAGENRPLIKGGYELGATMLKTEKQANDT